MIHPRKIDGSPISVFTRDGNRVYVDPEPEYDENGNKVTRGGPHHSFHYHRFEDYGLADDVLRCRKCGRVKVMEKIIEQG